MDCLKRRRPRENAVEEETSALETPEEKKIRWRSIYVIYFTMFLMSLGFSIILTGVWPYLDKLDPTAGKEFMGIVVAANPFAQMLFSPLVGWWGNKMGSIRLPLLTSLLLFTIASGIYSSLELFSEHAKYWMLWSRFLIGVSSANIAVCRSYLSAATTLNERTGAVSMISLAQVLGFIIGPALQAAVTPLGDSGVEVIPGKLSLNMYTAAGWINVLMGIFNCVIFLPFFFTEQRIAAKEAMVNLGAESEEATWKILKVDYLTSWTLIVEFFVLVFNFVILETLGTILTMEQFAWTKKEALSNMGILMAVGGVIACITFVAIGPMCKRFPERKVLMWGSFFLMVLGRALYIPWGPHTAKLAIYNETSNNSTEEVVGCPITQDWCTYLPAMTVTQFILGYALTSVGYPIGVTLIQTIFSKTLGPRPQGVWMGLMTGSGCFSRFLGPVLVSYIYTWYGTFWTFGLTTAMMVLSMIWLQVMEKRMASADPINRVLDKSKDAKEGEEVEALQMHDKDQNHVSNGIKINQNEEQR